MLPEPEKVSIRESHSKKETLLTRTLGEMRRFGLKARKGLGQHFLIDEEILEKIISAAELSPSDLVIEVGPGLGVLTKELASHVSSVIAVELDDKLAGILNKTLSRFKNVTIINDDILKVDIGTLLRERQVQKSIYKVVANLPYYITSPVLRYFLEAEVKPQLIVVMVQREVAEEISAKQGRMSLLSVSIHLYGKPEIISYVPAASFYPAPEVDSAILKIEVYPRPVIDVDIASFFILVRAGFSAARKQLVNSLAQGLDLHREKALMLLEQAGIAPQRRAETLTLEEWAKLWKLVYNKKKA